MWQKNLVWSLVEKIIDSYRRLDYAFNNAGIEQNMAPLAEQTVEEFDQIMNVNVRGVWLSMKYEIPEKIKNGISGGAIVNNSSVAGILGFPQMAIYMPADTPLPRSIIQVLQISIIILSTVIAIPASSSTTYVGTFSTVTITRSSALL